MYFWRVEYQRSIFPCQVSVPAVIRIFSFPTGLQREKEEILRRFLACADQYTKYEKRKPSSPVKMRRLSFLFTVYLHAS